MVYMERIGLFWTRDNRSRVLVPWGGLLLFSLAVTSRRPVACTCTLNRADDYRPRDSTGQATVHYPCGKYVHTTHTRAHIHTLAEGAGGVRRGGRGGEETVDRADFDGASRGEVRIEWLTLCPPGDPMDLKPMDAV